jgi:tetratricopeptide (TPR) repeat protein
MFTISWRYQHTAMEYLNFDLLISATDTPHEYQLHARTSTQGEANERTKIDLSVQTFLDWHAYLNARHLVAFDRPSDALAGPNAFLPDLKALGATLYQCLFAGKIGILFNNILGETLVESERGVRLRLRIQPPELVVLPWELLYSPERHVFLSTWLETPISHYLDLLEPVRNVACPGTLNMLVVIPQNSGLDTAAERAMLETLERKLGGKISVDFLPGLATSAAIRAALREKPYNIFHYAGHGGFDNDNAFIYIDHEENEGTQIAMAAGEFGRFFSDHPSMRLAILNACQGAARSSHQALIGAAPQLLLAGVPAVVAMRHVVDNDDAILFATEFYETLCQNRGQVEIAMTAARKAMLQERPASLAFCNPVLYLRSDDGRLWETNGRPFRANQLLRAAAVLLLLVAFAFGARWFLNSGRENVSVAVLDFENQTPDPNLGGVLADLLITDLAQNPNVKTLTKTRMLELSHAHGLKNIDMTAGLSLCRQEKIQVLISGKIIQVGEAYRVEASIFDFAAAEQFFAADFQGAGPKAILAMIDELSKQIKKKLHVKEARHDCPLPVSLEAYKRFAEGQSAYYSGDPIRAIQLAQQAVALDSIYVDAWRALAVWHDAIGDSSRALQHARRAKALSLNRGEIEYLQSLIVECQVLRNWDYNIAYLKRYLSLRPTDVNKHLQLGYVFSRGKMAFGEAIYHFNKVINLDRDNHSDRLAPAYNHLGMAYLFSDKFDSAMMAFHKYQALAPDNPDPLHSLGEAWSFHGDYEAAVDQFIRVIQQYPHYYKAYDDLGSAYLALGKWRKARQNFEAYLRAAPPSMSSRGHLLLARVYFIQGNPALAEQELQKALALDERNFQAHWLRGLNALSSANPDTAQKELQVMEKLAALPRAHDEMAYYHHLRGRMLLAEGKFPEGLSALQKAANASPRDFLYFKKELAEGYLIAGELEEAIREADGVKSFNANAADALNVLGQAYKSKGEGEKARQFFQQALQSWRAADADFYPLKRLQAKSKNSPHVVAMFQEN